jgi:PAS domain S-box-containing protein
MSAYLLLPLFACLASAILATALLARDARSRASRLAATVLLGGGLWSFCELLWNTAPDAETALALIKLSSLGWIAIGPMGLHLILEVIGESAPRLRRRLPLLYAVSLGFLVVVWTTPWIHTGVVRTDWGWGYELGPAYLLFLSFTFGTLATGLFVGARAHRHFPSPAERAQARWLIAGFLVPMTIASTTDGLLPYLGIQIVHLGTASFIVLGGIVAWCLHRYGFTLLVPEAYSREIVATMRDGLVMLRLDGRIRTANSAMARLAECSRQELVGMPLQAMLDPSPAMGVGTPTLFECELRSKSGRPVPVEISTSLLRDRQGRPCGSTALVRDRREVQSLRDRLVLSGRMAAVGQLAAGVAHEINNPVAYVSANLALLRRHWARLRTLVADGSAPAPEGEGPARRRRREMEDLFGEVGELIDESLEGVARTAEIVSGIRAFSHAGKAEREPAQLNAIVAAAVRMARPHLKHVPGVHVDYDDLPLLVCSPQEIQQVVVNLIINAADAVGSDGAITISTHASVDGVELVVGDDGEGIAPDALERIFDPFYTTKEVGEGTGLGLSVSWEIVDRHGGTIAVESAAGEGTTFRVRLPLAASPGDAG